MSAEPNECGITHNKISWKARQGKARAGVKSVSDYVTKTNVQSLCSLPRVGKKMQKGSKVMVVVIKL